MSRLARRRKKQSTTKMVLLFLFLVILVISFFSFGINFLINTSIFFANLSHKKTNQPTLSQPKKEIFYRLGLNEIPEATNEAKFIVKGQAQNFNKINFYLNDEKIKSISLEKEDFQATLNGLKEGKNILYLEGVDEANNERRPSSSYEITYINKKPNLTITTPDNNSTTDKNETTVTGETGKDIFVKINNRPVVVDVDGKFSDNVRLKEGDNEIKIQASDLAGNQTEKVIKITYSKED